jgi:hypothetical protein
MPTETDTRRRWDLRDLRIEAARQEMSRALLGVASQLTQLVENGDIEFNDEADMRRWLYAEMERFSLI